MARTISSARRKRPLHAPTSAHALQAARRNADSEEDFDIVLKGKIPGVSGELDLKRRGSERAPTAKATTMLILVAGASLAAITVTVICKPGAVEQIAAVCTGHDASGVWNQRYDEVDDLARARRLPSPQLVGCSPAARATCSRSQTSRWSACLTRSTSGLGRTDVTPRPARRSASRRPGCRPRPGCSSTWAAARSARSCGRRVSGPTTDGSTCRWSTREATCATTAAWSAPGLYALGLPVLRRRKSTFIHGIEDDARDVSHLTPLPV